MQFLTPKNLKEALEFFEKFPGYKILAGGTDLCVLMNSGKLKPEGLINIWGIGELQGIKEEKDFLEIGALTTHREICKSAAVRQFVPVLADACKTIGAVQIQNRGTIGGNVMNASPAGDTLPVLLAHDAEVEVASLNGKRWVPFAKFYEGYRKTALNKNEILAKIKIPKADSDEKSTFVKIGQRKAQAISKVMGCFRILLEGAGTESISYKDNVGAGFRPPHVIKYAAIAFGSIAPVPVRLPKTEKLLVGKKLDEKLIGNALKSVGKEVAPIDDIRSTAPYRRHVCCVLLERFLRSIRSGV